MKKDRNCGGNMAPYPIYPMQPGMAPISPGMMPMQPGMMPMNPGMMPMQPGMMPMNPGMSTTSMMPPMSIPNTSIPNQAMMSYNGLAAQVNNLEKRVTALENLVKTSTYNTSNFQMM